MHKDGSAVEGFVDFIQLCLGGEILAAPDACVDRDKYTEIAQESRDAAVHPVEEIGGGQSGEGSIKTAVIII